MNGQTDGRTDDPITSMPPGTFQAGGIKTIARNHIRLGFPKGYPRFYTFSCLTVCMKKNDHF